jgi:hypothetical protein
MNISRVMIYILIVCAFLVIAAQPVHAAISYLVTQTVTSLPTGRTSAQSQSNTPAMTPSKTATTTLIPLPAITLIFPASTPTPTATVTTTPASADATPQYQGNTRFNSLSPRYKLLAGLIALLWVILIGFVILFIRQYR